MIVFFSFGSGRGAFNWLALIPLLLQFGPYLVAEIGSALLEPIHQVFRFTSSQAGRTRATFSEVLTAALFSLTIIGICAACVLHALIWVSMWKLFGACACFPY